MKKKQNEVFHIYLTGSDLAQRQQEVLKDASEKLDFQIEKISGQSNWWGSSEIGAFFVSGTYQNIPAVLKIQGVKTDTSEIFMINAFDKANNSKVVRPPKVYGTTGWDEEKRYEALILEVAGKKAVNAPTTKDELNKFFNCYVEYRKNCLNSPWLDKPEETLSQKVERNFKLWREAGFKRFPTHPFRKEEDESLITKSVEILKNGYKDVDFEFQHGHFSARDVRLKDNQFILLSNLYWGWKAPLYDAVFGMHWFIYQLADLKDITTEIIEEQRNLWLEKIESLPQVKNNQKLYQLALLERAAAGLNLDALSTGDKEINKYLVEKTREQVKTLINSLDR